MGSAWVKRCRKGESRLAQATVEDEPLKSCASSISADIKEQPSDDSPVPAEHAKLTINPGSNLEISGDDWRLVKLLDAAYGSHVSSPDDPASWEGYCMVESENDASNSALYGELLPAAFIWMIRHLGFAETSTHFFDLGSGTGKLVNLAGLLGLRATGIELEPERYRASCDARNSIFQKENRARRASGLPLLELPKFVQGSFLKYDFSSANLVFAASVVYSDAMMEALAVTARKMKPGAKLVSYKMFPEPGFRCLGQIGLHVSWRADTEGTATFQVQEVVQIDENPVK